MVRSSDLTINDAIRLYSAMSYSMWKYGLDAVVTSHIIISWNTLLVEDNQHAALLLGKFLNQARKKFGRERLVDMRPGRRRNWQHVYSGFKLNYVFVWENGAKEGLHTHILATIPWNVAPLFKTWSERCLTRLAGQPCTPETIVVRAPQTAPNVAMGWVWLRYCLKQLSPALVPLRQLIRVWAHREALPVSLRRLTVKSLPTPTPFRVQSRPLLGRGISLSA
jgi:hypothetical protein